MHRAVQLERGASEIDDDVGVRSPGRYRVDEQGVAPGGGDRIVAGAAVERVAEIAGSADAVVPLPAEDMSERVAAVVAANQRVVAASSLQTASGVCGGDVVV